MEKEIWSQIRIMGANGKSKRWIAKELKVSRNTVKRALSVEVDPTKEQERKKAGFQKLVEFKDEIIRMLKQGLIGSRILHELRKQGYMGGGTNVYMCLKEIKKEIGYDEGKVIERYETLPGVQGQFDWSKYVVDFSGSLVVIYVYNLILSYSRRKFFWVSRNDRQPSVLEAIEKALWHFGGCPKELLVDNARCLVTNPKPENFKWNETFYNFCGYYRIKPVACRVRRPQTKGKVERPFFYLEHHFIRGNKFNSIEDFANRLQEFCVELDGITHPTTGFKPIDRFDIEKEHLAPLPPNPFISPFRLPRKVSWDCLISYNGARYSVPYQYAGKEVFVHESQGSKIEIYSSKFEIIATYKIAKKGECVILKEHYEGLRKDRMKTVPMLRDRFLKEFPNHGLFFQSLSSQYKFSTAQHIRQILSLIDYYPKETIEKAFSVALNYNTFSHSFIRAVVEKFHKLNPVSVSKPVILNSFSIPSVDIKRDLNDYQSILKNIMEVKK